MAKTCHEKNRAPNRDLKIRENHLKAQFPPKTAYIAKIIIEMWEWEIRVKKMWEVGDQGEKMWEVGDKA